MARNYTSRPRPPHLDQTPCQKCRWYDAAVVVEAERLSRSQNWRRFTVGAYCRLCANALLARAKLDLAIDEAFGGEGGAR